MTVWYTADPHWGHRFVAELRGFKTPEEHDEWLHSIYAAHFLPGDLVFWLGDLTMRMKPRQASLMCHDTQQAADHRLVYGNHDAGHPMHRKAHRHGPDYWPFISREPFMKRNISGVEVLLSHFPYADVNVEGEPDRFLQWRLPDLGVPIIHGHTHSREQVSRTANGTLQVHVGVDAWRGPVGEREVFALLAEA